MSINNKSHRFDIHCKDYDDNDFIVEMQRDDFKDFMKRVNKSHDTRINNSSNLVKRCWFIDNEGQDFENQFINLIFVRLYEVNDMPEPDKNTPSIERCCWLMTNLPEMTTEPSPEVVGEFGEIVQAAKIAGYNKQKKRAYKMGMDYEQMQKAINQQQYRNGLAEGKVEESKQPQQRPLDNQRVRTGGLNNSGFDFILLDFRQLPDGEPALGEL